MQIFQSWLDTILIFGLLITNLVVIVIYKRQVESLKSRNEELERTNKSSLTLASERANDVDAFKKMYDPDYFKKYLDIHVKVEVEKAKATQQANLDNEQIKELITFLNEAASFIAFYLHVEKQYDRDKRIKFFHAFFDKSKDLFWWSTNQKIENVEKQKSLTQPKTPDA